MYISTVHFRCWTERASRRQQQQQHRACRWHRFDCAHKHRYIICACIKYRKMCVWIGFLVFCGDERTEHICWYFVETRVFAPLRTARIREVRYLPIGCRTQTTVGHTVYTLHTHAQTCTHVCGSHRVDGRNGRERARLYCSLVVFFLSSSVRSVALPCRRCRRWSLLCTSVRLADRSAFHIFSTCTTPTLQRIRSSAQTVAVNNLLEYARRSHTRQPTQIEIYTCAHRISIAISISLTL